MSSLSVEPCERGSDTHVALFEIEATPAAVAAFIDREHEFRFGGVQASAWGVRANLDVCAC